MHFFLSFPFPFFLISHIRARNPFGLAEARTLPRLRLQGARTSHDYLSHFCFNIGLVLHQSRARSLNTLIFYFHSLHS